MFTDAIAAITNASTIVIVQAENPDGDSLGSALALEEILGDLGKSVSLHCPVTVPQYLRYFPGWDRVSDEFDTKADLAIIVDTSAELLLSQSLEIPGVRHFFETHPVVVIDHHQSESTLTFDTIAATGKAAATGELILAMAEAATWTINPQAAEHLLGSLLSDTLGLSTPSVSQASYITAATCVRLGAHPSKIEERRREFIKKSPEILAYKAKLIERIEYECDGKLAIVRVPFEEIEHYSDQYNPGALIGDELRLVTGVQVSCVIKTYPDGKLTARLRTNAPVADTIAAHFGGGGHAYAAGFRVYDAYDDVRQELPDVVARALEQTERESGE